MIDNNSANNAPVALLDVYCYEHITAWDATRSPVQA